MNPRHHSPTPRPGHRTAGFTMTEMLVVSMLSVMVISVASISFIHHRKAYIVQEERSGMFQSARIVALTMAHEVRMAGYGIKVPDNEISAWFTWGPAMTNAVMVTQGTSGGPDTLSIIGGIEPPASHVVFGTVTGDCWIPVTPGTSSQFNQTDKSVVLIGKLEMARVTETSMDRIKISTDPVLTDVPLTYVYPSGTPIELIKKYSYSCGVLTNGTTTNPYIIRDDYSAANTTALPEELMLAGGIEDLQLVSSSNSVSIILQARTPRPNPFYTHPTQLDGYRRTWLRSMIVPRNLR